MSHSHLIDTKVKGEKMKLYAYTLVAQKRTQTLYNLRTEFLYRPGVMTAENEEEAIGKCYTNVHEIYPTSEGFEAQDFSVFEIGSVVKTWAWD